MPDAGKRTDLAQFYDEVGSNYNEEEVVYRDLRGILRKKFVLSFLEKEQGNFLDLGCNNGIYSKYFKGDLTIGIDLANSLLLQARNVCKEWNNSKKHFFIRGNIENLKFIRNIKFDFILCSEVLEHLFSPEKVFFGISQLLKSNGKALITTPNYKKKKPTWIQLGELKTVVSGEEYFHTAFRPAELIQMAKNENLEVLESGTLEWEVKYAAKIPALFFIAFRFINKNLLRSRKVDQINQRMFERFTLLCYHFATISGLEKLFKPFIREGVRSFIVLTKK